MVEPNIAGIAAAIALLFLLGIGTQINIQFLPEYKGVFGLYLGGFNIGVGRLQIIVLVPHKIPEESCFYRSTSQAGTIIPFSHAA